MPTPIIVKVIPQTPPIKVILQWVTSVAGPGGSVAWGDVTGKPSTFAPSAHTQAASTISDSTTAGRALLTAADNTAQRTLLALGGSATLNVGTLAGTVAAGDHNHTGVYALVVHNHDGAYAAISHNHDAAYAAISHGHAPSDLAAGGASVGQVLTWNGTNYAPATPSGGGGGVSDGDKTDVTVTGTGTIWTLKGASVLTRLIETSKALYAPTGDTLVLRNATGELAGTKLFAVDSFLASAGVLRLGAGGFYTEILLGTLSANRFLTTPNSSGVIATEEFVAARTYPYTLTIASVNVATLTDAGTLYFGANVGFVPSATADIYRVYIPKDGTIKRAYIFGNFNVAGSDEDWSMYIRLNNTTDTLVQTLADGTTKRLWSNTSLNIAVVAGDYVEIKIVNPTWATNPTNGRWNGTIYIE